MRPPWQAWASPFSSPLSSPGPGPWQGTKPCISTLGRVGPNSIHWGEPETHPPKESHTPFWVRIQQMREKQGEVKLVPMRGHTVINDAPQRLLSNCTWLPWNAERAASPAAQPAANSRASLLPGEMSMLTISSTQPWSPQRGKKALSFSSTLRQGTQREQTLGPGLPHLTPAPL